MKHRDPVWQFFAISEDKGKTVAHCKACNLQVSSKVERLKAHKLKCDILDSVSLSPSHPAKRSLDDVTPDTRRDIADATDGKLYTYTVYD